MAEEAVDRAEFTGLRLGIQDTEILGDYETAEAFLSGEEVTPIKKEEEKKDPPKKEEKAEEKKVETEEKKTDPLEDLKEDEEEEEKKQTNEGFDYEALSKDLFRIGIFTELEEEDEIKTPEDIVKRFEKEKEIGAMTWLENFLSQYGEDRREMFQAIYMDGVDPKKYLPVFNTIQDFEKLDLTIEDNQKLAFKEFYRRVGLDEAVIEKKLQKAIDYGDLETDAREAIPQLIAQDKKKLEDMAAKDKALKENDKRLDLEYKSSLQTKLSEAVQKKEFKGIPITQDKAVKVLDFLYSPKYKTSDGKVLTEFDRFIIESKKPENIESRILLGLLKLDNFDLSKIEKQGVSKASSEIFSELATKVVKSKTRDISKIPGESNTKAWSNL